MAELVQNAKGRYVQLSSEEAEFYLSRTAFDKATGLPRRVSPKDGDYAEGCELAAGGKGEGVRGDKPLTRTGEGLVPQE